MAALDPFMNAHPPVRAELPNAMCGWHLLGPRIFHLFLCPNHQVMSLTKPWRSHGTKVRFATRVREVLRWRTIPLTASHGNSASKCMSCLRASVEQRLIWPARRHQLCTSYRPSSGGRVRGSLSVGADLDQSTLDGPRLRSGSPGGQGAIGGLASTVMEALRRMVRDGAAHRKLSPLGRRWAASYLVNERPSRSI